MRRLMLHTGRRVAVLLPLLFLIGGTSGVFLDADAETSSVMERRVKTAFLYKFAGYVEWPAESFPRPGTPIVVGVAGDKRMAAELSQLVLGRTSGGRRILVVQPDLKAPLRDLHILFVASGESRRLRQWVEALQGAHTLVVTESENALDQGSMINFVLSEGHVRFEIATSPAEKCGLQLSSGLLGVAKSVVSPRP
ncbi:MAG TPA: YfiR family protein [Candidatus Polarisedimenticolia bacterium]|nr:YfiR family protein [Candidatus Polarisedimenticolia bacterium]